MQKIIRQHAYCWWQSTYIEPDPLLFEFRQWMANIYSFVCDCKMFWIFSLFRNWKAFNDRRCGAGAHCNRVGDFKKLQPSTLDAKCREFQRKIRRHQRATSSCPIRIRSAWSLNEETRIGIRIAGLRSAVQNLARIHWTAQGFRFFFFLSQLIY